MKMIQQINRDVLALDNNELLRTAVVFPSRRAALLFQKEFVLAKGSDCTWMPTLITVNEFYLQSLQRVKSDELELLTVLHQVYQNYWKDLDFGSFMNLGKIILSDFDAIDRYLVDAKLLYRNLKEWKDIEEVFDEGWEKFTQQLDNSKSIIGTALEKIWEKMYSIYSDFQLALQKADLQYTGKNLLELHNEIYHNEKFKLPFDHVFVCGLNALSTSELQIWKKLSADGIAHTYWMTDNLFTDVAFITAGKFQKKAKNIFNGVNDHWTASDMFQHPKNIVIKECSSRVVLNQVVSNFIAIDDEQKRLIVLADESKLTDLVNHITPQLDQVNITMGYPVSSTHVYSFLDTTVAILRNVVIRDNRIWFKDSEKILQLIHHPWIDKDIRQAILESLHQYANYLEVDDFKNLFKEYDILAHFSETSESSNILKQVIDLLLHFFRQTETIDVLDRQGIYVIVKTLKVLDKSLVSNDISLNYEQLSKLLFKHIKGLSIPMDTDYDHPTQIMGLLETRGLDADELMIVDATDKLLPRSSRSQSYIPPTIRKYYNLPLTEDSEAITAFYFYSLLTNAKNITLLVTNKDEMETTEITRFIKQIEYLQPTHQWNIAYEQLKANNNKTVHRSKKTFSIEKNETTLPKTTREKPHSISPSSFLIYLKCEAQYYFKKILKLNDDELIDLNEIDIRRFGNIVHDTMENVYQPLLLISKKRELNNADFTEISEKDIHNGVEKAINKNLPKLMITDQPSKIKIQLTLVKAIVRKMIDKDALSPPKKIFGLEQHFSNIIPFDDNYVNINGFVDRIDISEDSFLLIDYKTGEVKMSTNKSDKTPETYFEDLFKNIKKNDHLIQLWMYIVGLSKNNTIQGSIEASVIDIGKKQKRNDIQLEISDTNIALFSEKLYEQISHILNSEKYDQYEQKIDKDHCKYCPFTATCGITANKYQF